jgi:hypothetical protein
MRQAVGLQQGMCAGPRAAACPAGRGTGLALGWYDSGLRPERQAADPKPGISVKTKRCIEGLIYEGPRNPHKSQGLKNLVLRPSRTATPSPDRTGRTARPTTPAPPRPPGRCALIPHLTPAPRRPPGEEKFPPFWPGVGMDPAAVALSLVEPWRTNQQNKVSFWAPRRRG